MTPDQPSVETLVGEIESLVAERQELRRCGAAAAELEQNRRQIAAAQMLLSRLLVARHVSHPATA